jgi:hypothetical protein
MVNKMFKFYLYGYLNDYYAHIGYLNQCEVSFYKKLKVEKTISYLKLPNKYSTLFRKCSWILSMCEIYISLFIISFRLVKYCLNYFLTTPIKVTNTNLMLGLNNEYYSFITMMKSVDINEDDITMLAIPSIEISHTMYKRISIFSGIDFTDIFKAFYNSFKMIFFIKKKYGKRDLFFRAYSSFEYFIVYFYVNKSNTTNKYYFDATICKWAYLLCDLPHEKHFIQHGVITDKVKFKRVGKVDYAYYINQNQKGLIEKILFKNNPISFYRSETIFGYSNILVDNKLKNILLICHTLFFDLEKKIISQLSRLNVNLYVKPHPSNSYQPYEDLILSNNFILLQKMDFPNVDIVISYFSTLAFEYESKGTEVLIHSDDLFQQRFNEVIRNLKN